MTAPLLARVADCLERSGIPFALIGAAALAVHGVSRSTLDQDLLVVDVRTLAAETWAPLAATVSVDVRLGDADDPLAGVVRLTARGERDVDVVVGRGRWNGEILERAVPTHTPHGLVPVATAADLVLLKLYAGGPQDLWDIAQLRAAGIPNLDADVSARLTVLPERSRRAWSRVTAPGAD